MLSVVLAPALAAQVEASATACGVARDVVGLAAVALLRRRYTGEARFDLDWNGTTVHCDLTDDRPVRTLLAELAAAGSPEPASASASAGPEGSDPADAASELAVEPGAPDRVDGPLATAARLDGATLRLACDEPLRPAAAEDLPALLAALTADPDRSTVDLLPASAYGRRPVLQPLLPAYRSIPEAFAAVAEQCPDQPAVLADDAGLTYRELATAVAATAGQIHAAAPVNRSAATATAPGTAAVLCRHGASTVIAVLAAMSAGRAYVPLDPSYPTARLVEILRDSDAGVVVTDDQHREQAEQLLAAAGRAGTPIVHTRQTGSGGPAPDLPTPEPDDPAYVLYTSGSTGVPKGVVQSHRNVLTALANHIRRFGLTPADRTSVVTSFGFDMAVTDTFSALLCGAAAVPVDVRTQGLGPLGAILAERGVTVYHSTPTVFRYLAANLTAPLPALRTVLLGGEEVTRHDATLARRHCAPDVVFVNGYGATEISFAAQNFLAATDPVDDAVVPIGVPLEGVEVVLVDAAGRPTGLAGEILVRAGHVATGYWRRPELTAQRFGEYRGERCYRTGDLARRLPDGRLVYLGRADRLVKIRGNRVELGEVETRLAAAPGVGQAAVVARPDAHAELGIVGYVVPAAGAVAPNPAALRALLAEQLPEFMVPRAVVLLDALPMGRTGKLDAAALPEPPPVTAGAAAPVGRLEELVAAAWCAAIGIDRVDRDVRFGDAGGHSLHLATVQQQLERELGRRVPMTQLFEFPTVAELAAHLAGEPTTAVSHVDRMAERMRRRREARA